MMPTRALERLVDEAAQRCSRLILVGDRAQLPAIDAAGGFAALADRLGAAELTGNRRQRTDLQRQFAEHLAEGRSGEALSLLAEHGGLLGFDDARDARAALIAAWAETSLSDPGSGLILAHDRYEVALLNQMARAALDDAGLLGPSRLVASGREWAAGDRLVCRRNDYRLCVRNGTRGTVLEIDAERRTLVVRTDESATVRLPGHYLGDVQHGYALTGHISQGATVARTYLLATPDRGGKEWAYVAATRQRVDLVLFAVHHEPERLEAALARSWERSDAKHLALDLADAGHGAAAVRAARGELERTLPERLVTRVGVLRDRREGARAMARASEGEGAARARQDAQAIGAQLRAIEPVLSEWSARAEVARPSAGIISVFGPRPIEPSARRAWDRAVITVATYRHARAISLDEPSLLGPRPSSGDARSAWDTTVAAAGETLRTLQRPSEALARWGAEERERPRER